MHNEWLVLRPAKMINFTDFDDESEEISEIEIPDDLVINVRDVLSLSRFENIVVLQLSEQLIQIDDYRQLKTYTTDEMLDKLKNEVCNGKTSRKA